MIKQIVAVLMMILCTMVLPTQIISAQGSCNEIVLDEAGVFGPRIDQVTMEAQKLINLGADVRVLTIRTFEPASNLDDYVEQIQRSCLSWQAADGGWKNNLIVLIVAVDDHKTGLYYGSQWERALKPNWTRIQTDLMNPRFRDGDFAGGFINGLREIQRLIDLEIHPPTPAPAQPQQPPVVVVQPTQPPSPPPDLSGLWKVLMWLVVLGVLAVIGYFGYRFVNTYLAEKTKRRAAQQKARLAKQATVSRITGWDEKVRRLETTLIVLAEQVAEEEIEGLRMSMTQAQKIYDAATMTYANLDSSAGDPDRPGLTIGEYEAIEAAYNKVLNDLQLAETALAEIHRKTEKMSRLIADAPKVLEAAGDVVTQARQQIVMINQQGFKTEDASAILEKAEAALSQAEKALKEKRLQQAVQSASEAQNLAKEASRSVSLLPKQKQQIEGAIADLQQRIEAVKAQIITGRAIFEEIASTYAESCWESIRGNGTEAENRVNWSLQALETARDLATMERQEWKKAQEQVAKANSWLDEAGSFMRSISALKTNLETAKHDAAGEIQAAQADIDKARSYIKKYDPDIRENLETDLANAQKVLDDAKAELAKDKPNYLKVVKLAKQANASADQILAEARSEHETAERLRQSAASALRDARAAVSKAKEYIEDHSSDVGRTAENYLEEAKDALQSAEGATSLESMIYYAEKAEENANEAYSKAKNDVEEAEEARRPRYTYTGYAGWGSPSTHRDDDTPSFGWSSSGGSSSWGHSSGSGGSTSWGHSSRGGGSTGW